MFRMHMNAITWPVKRKKAHRSGRQTHPRPRPGSRPPASTLPRTRPPPRPPCGRPTPQPSRGGARGWAGRGRLPRPGTGSARHRRQARAEGCRPSHLRPPGPPRRLGPRRRPRPPVLPARSRRPGRHCPGLRRRRRAAAPLPPMHQAASPPRARHPRLPPLPGGPHTPAGSGGVRCVSGGDGRVMQVRACSHNQQPWHLPQTPPGPRTCTTSSNCFSRASSRAGWRLQKRGISSDRSDATSASASGPSGHGPATAGRAPARRRDC